MKKYILIGAGGVVLIGVIALAVFYMNFSRIVTTAVETAAPKLLGVDVKLAKVKLSPFSGKGSIHGLVIGNPKGFKTESAIRVGTARLWIEPKSLASDKIIIREVFVDGPEITYEKGLRGSNISALLDNLDKLAGSSGKPAPKEEKTEETSKPAPKLQIDSFVIQNGKVHLSAKLLKGKAATVPLLPIRLKDMGQGPEGITPKDAAKTVLGAVSRGTLKAVTNAGALIKGGAKAAKDTAGKALKGVKGLFRRKK